MNLQPINVLSLFDGMSCGRIALERAGIKVDNYYASEIDKYAMKVSKANYPNIIQLGSVTELKNIDWNDPKIDLLIGGSPCQGFSFAGKQLNFDDPRSKLFFEYVRVLNEIRLVNPEVKFFLENVKMKKEYQDVISGLLRVQPIEVNSALVSAQNRKRLYWTNIEGFSMPEDKGILLEDIKETPGEYIKISKKGVYKKHQNRMSCLTAGGNSDGNHSDMDLIGVKKECLEIGTAIDINGHDILKRIYSVYGKSPTFSTCGGGNTQPKIALNDYEYRRLTPLEFERGQTVTDNYTNHVSNSQRYKMLGNGWTIEVITEFFKHLKPKTETFNDNLDF